MLNRHSIVCNLQITLYLCSYGPQGDPYDCFPLGFLYISTFLCHTYIVVSLRGEELGQLMCMVRK